MWRYRDCLQCQALPEIAEGVNDCFWVRAVPLDRDSILLISCDLSTHLHLPGMSVYKTVFAVDCFRHLSLKFFIFFFHLARTLSCLPLLLKPS